MARAYEAVLSMPLQDQPSISQFIARLVEAEMQERTQKRTQMFLLQSKLRYNAVLEQVHCNTNRNLSQEKLMMLADCSFIDRSENLLISGATGCGKSYLACAIGRRACSFGYRTLYFGMSRFLERISNSRLDGSFIKLLNQIERTHLLILDDFGLHPLDGHRACSRYWKTDMGKNLLLLLLSFLLESGMNTSGNLQSRMQ